jgi:lysophospholipase L1-like esterase
MKIGNHMGLGAVLRPGLDPDAAAIIARMSVAPGATNAAAINALVTALKAGGVWGRLAAFQVYAAHDAQAALLDWKRAGVSATLHGSPTPVHHANKHFYSAGSPAYLNTKFNPSTDGAGLYTQNDASFGWYNGHGSAVSAWSGAFQGSTVNRTNFIHATPRLDMGINDTADRAGTTQGAYGRLHGLCSVSRTGAAATATYVRGTAAGTHTGTSTALANAEMFGFANNINGTANNFTANKLCAFFAGASLSQAQTAALSAALDAYMIAVGNWRQPVACWGDSLTVGGLPPYPGDWRNQVELGGSAVQTGNTYRWVHNAGVIGETAAQIRARMVADATYQSAIQIIWAGRNAFLGQTATVLSEIAAMVAAAEARSGKYLVLSVTNGQPNAGVTSGLQGSSPNWEDLGTAPHTDIVTINTALAAAYGTRYVDVRGPLVAAGTAPEIARDVPALTHLLTNDPIHFGTLGAAVIAAQINAKLDSLGW